MTSLINPQLQSKFFTAPAEIRYAILANVVPETVHLSLNKKGLGLSPCVQRDNDDDPNCWNRCRTIGPDSGTDSRVSDSIYASRLRSSWGEHWRCESLVAYKQDNKDLDQRSDPLILVCKQMLIDYAQVIADTARFHVHNLATLNVIVSHSSSQVLESDPFCTSAFLQCGLPNPKNLSIGLKLPLAAYEAIENAPMSPQSSPVSAWLELPHAIPLMNKLRKLHIWLDHDEPCTWTTVNERAVLSPLASLSTLPHLEVSINLPKLHPKWETLDKHFMEDSGQLPLPIHRRYRQRSHGVEDRNGNLKAVDKADFPILFEMAGYEYWTAEELRKHNGEPSVPYDPDEIELENLRWEEEERRIWKEGHDPEKELEDFYGCTLRGI